MNTEAAINYQYHNRSTRNFNHSAMPDIIHAKSPSESRNNQYKLNAGDVVSIFGDGEKKRTMFADSLIEGLGKNKKVARINLSKVLDGSFNTVLERQKRHLKSMGCPEQIRMAECLKVALDARALFEKPVDLLSPEEKAKMFLVMELSSAQPDAIIINRPSIIRQFNRKIRALRQVFKKTYIMTDQVWNFPLSITSDRVFEVYKGKTEESFMTL